MITTIEATGPRSSSRTTSCSATTATTLADDESLLEAGLIDFDRHPRAGRASSKSDFGIRSPTPRSSRTISTRSAAIVAYVDAQAAPPTAAAAERAAVDHARRGVPAATAPRASGDKIGAGRRRRAADLCRARRAVGPAGRGARRSAASRAATASSSSWTIAGRRWSRSSRAQGRRASSARSTRRPRPTSSPTCSTTAAPRRS